MVRRTLALKEYNSLIGIIMLIGLGCSALLMKFTVRYFASWSLFALILVYVAVAFVGVLISEESGDPKQSFIGFMLVVAPSGIVMNRIFSAFRSTVVAHALSIAIGMVIVMTILGYFLPKFFLEAKNMMIMSILTVVILEVIAKQAGWSQMQFFHLLIAGALSLYIAYIWTRGQKYEHTVGAAVDVGVEYYLRPINKIKSFMLEYTGREE